MINRRKFLGLAAGAGGALTLSPELLRALQQSQLIQRAIPSSGEMLPVIGLARGNVPADAAALEEVLKTLVDNGGRVLDMVHGGTSAEQVTGTMANELGIQNRIFWSTQVRVAPLPPGTPAPDVEPATAKADVEASFARLKVPRIDLIHVRPTTAPTHLAVLKELKKEGRVRYIGVTAAFDNQYAGLESIMRNEPIDFISVDYAIDNRNVEDTILPLAEERKIAVLACFPFGGNVGPDRTTVVSRLFGRAGTTPLPDWAADFDARTWGQFFLKYVISHPAVTVVRVGTDKAKHMLDNIGGGSGRLPDEATRRRMAQFVDALPAAPAAGSSPKQQAPPAPVGSM